MKNIISLLLWCALSFSAGWFGSQFKPGAWYQDLRKPAWTPPPIVFPIAWALLYTLMSVAAWLVWRKRGEGPLVSVAIGLFLLQLILNALWSWIFFGCHQIGWALIEIIVLWLMVVFTFLVFFSLSRASGYLLIPYLVWIGFAVVLNWAIWKSN
jgi:tryptophan-rich sensory protein